jgi:hypothetical protein
MIRWAERWPVSAWITRLALAGCGIGIVVVLGFVWSVTRSAKEGLCPALSGYYPLTSFPYPSQTFVFTAIGAYVAGHLSSRYAVEVRPQLAGLLGADTFQRDRVVLVVKLIVTGFLLLVTILNVYEAVAFATGEWPITYYVWCASAASPPLALFGAGIVSFLVGRWLWPAS